ncbi:hypothetical protein COCC4DRAFT_68578 [Bipolaris maydis ATCC 48331]|uniref:MalT-like TPR region domain-containing protein n=2 Tax=Cochliobolus heterostrophus TaxID=5016 RepID=N4XV48_COCH4|nr:uncharacterized protein COCC4DRAFT_68578 [Bipolaris maydis ATCC 48331]ENI10251.1 hypothetical protein COCC4DRAFT_68578 [Bipolaris maydis ATCC 48331]
MDVVLGTEDVISLDSKMKLAHALSQQHKNRESEILLPFLLYSQGGESDEVGQLLQELVRPQEKALGTQDSGMHRTKHLLAMTLWEREWYAEAERILKQLIQQRKGVENADCDDNLASKHMLAVTLYMHGLHAEAERMLQKVVQQRELLLGLGHEDTIESKRWLAAMRDRRVKPTERRHLSSQSVQGPQKVLTIHYESNSARK